MRLSAPTKCGLWLVAVLAVAGRDAPAQTPKLKPVPFTAVDIRSEFWTVRQRVNREKTIPHLLKMCEQEGRVRNLLRAAGALDGEFEGTRYHDADLFKAIEAASYTLAIDCDPQLDGKLDELIAAISTAQGDDGYLHTYAQVRARGRNRPTELNLFAAGHLLHAGAAHFEATGKRSLLTAAVRMADLIASQYGPGRQRDVPPHPIPETALFRLAKATGEDRYAELAMFFIHERGCAARSGRRSYGVHGVDDVPLRNLHDARGHVIVTLFLVSGMYDAAMRFDDSELLAACRRLFHDAVTRRMYLTGAMGRQSDERFTEPYALDNRTSIGEGCQSAALMQLAQRLLLLTADACYADVIERVMINNLAANVGLDGTRFYYYNRLAARPEDATGRPYRGIVTETDRSRMPRNCLDRQPWFKVPCCPPNVAIAMATIGQYAYATSHAGVYVNQYLSSNAVISVGAARLRITQKTRYPWDGQIKVTVAPDPSRWRGELCLRIPDWRCQLESTGDLYRPRPSPAGDAFTVRVNGRAIAPTVLRRGYLVLERDWEKGDSVEIDLPMPVLRITSHPLVVVNRGRVALERGPTVYCIEAVDHDGRTRNVVLPREAALRAEHRPELLEGVTVLLGEARRRPLAEEHGEPVRLFAVPYGVWGNRGAGEMDVWLPEDAVSTERAAEPTR